MKRFEYIVVYLENNVEYNMERYLNSMGLEGWEMVFLVYSTDKREIFFKRELQDQGKL